MRYYVYVYNREMFGGGPVYRAGLQNFHNFILSESFRKLSGNFLEISEILKVSKILLIDTFSSYKLLTSDENWLIL